jgi:hypothetical protein
VKRARRLDIVPRLLLAGIALALTAAAPPAPGPGKGLKLIDLTDDFDRVWEATKEVPDDKRAAAFEQAFAKILPGFYDPKRVADFATEAQYQAMVLEGLKKYPEQREGIRRVSREFAASIAPAQRSFEKAFGPMRGFPPVYLVNSFGEFDGGTRELPEGERLMFGADMIDRLYQKTPIQPFFHHELFHLLHQRTFEGCGEVWCSLWSEGLAVYVASRLNPGASDASLLLVFPKPIRPAVEAHKAEAICAVRKRLDSRDSDDRGALFRGNGKTPSANLPPRFGYYVGYLVAADLGKTRSLKQLAALNVAQVKPLIAASLARMASCQAGETERG